MYQFHEFIELVRMAKTCDLASSTCLKNLRDLFFVCLIICTGFVAIGLVMEVGEIWHDAREAIWEKSLEFKHWLALPIDRKEYPARLSRCKKLFATMGWVLIVVGVVGEGVFEGLVHKYDVALSTLSDSLIAETQREAAQLRKDAEDLRAENLKLAASIAWRRLSEEQQKTLRSELSAFTEMTTVTEYDVGDSEASSFALDIARSFGRGWTAGAPEGAIRQWLRKSLEINPGPSPGVIVRTADDKLSEKAGAVFARELNKFGFDCSHLKHQQVGASHPNIFVEHRPLGPQGEFKLRAESDKKNKTASAKIANP
jgi:hypothetical protein